MALRLPVSLQAAPGVWLGRADREDLAELGKPLSEGGTRSVLVVRDFERDHGAGFLSVHPSALQLANLGASKDVLVIAVDHFAMHPVSWREEISIQPAVPSESKPDIEAVGDEEEAGADSDFLLGDYWFLDRLTDLDVRLQQIGILILAKIRKSNPTGVLRYYHSSSSKRFVESPDNFWTIQPQPRAGDFVITVRGKPEEFTASRIEVKADRYSYSRFKVASLDQVDEAVRLILSARRKDPK